MIKISDFLDDLGLSEQQTYRGDCPLCRGKNTFTVTSEYGHKLYNCYKNTCKISGVHHHLMDKDGIERALARLAGKDRQGEASNQQDLCPYVKPPYLVPYHTIENTIDPTFLDRYGISPRKVFYDVRQDRVVFPVLTESNVLVDAVGRSLTGRQPKWLRYAASPMPYTQGDVNSTDVVVVVEDAISAYVVSNLFTAGKVCGLALLGTQLTQFHKDYIEKHWDNVIIALDADALDKTIKMSHELNCKAVYLYDDIKYKREDDIAKLSELVYG